MRSPFNKISELLEDPFFEANLLGKVAIRQRVCSPDKYPDRAFALHFEDWRAEDDSLIVQYSFADSVIGELLVATTPKGVCYLGFVNESRVTALNDLRRRFSYQKLEEIESASSRSVVAFCNGYRDQAITLHLKGTAFQLDIWKKLVRIPEGKVATYASLGPNSKAARAVGSAVGDNPVFYIIPCHRVVRGDGSFQGYFWGTELKRKLLAWEFQTL